MTQEYLLAQNFQEQLDLVKPYMIFKMSAKLYR